MTNHPLRDRIMAYLEGHGPRRTSDISAALRASKGATQYHLSALESASLVRSNIPPESRARSTPFYTLVGVSSDASE
ncbi:ArsR family transcriptional regulator [Micrococcaceae bacterium Sec5.7]